ncbi:DUF4328 domain-containing protein [Actinoplanes sp. NPDC051346]|uniref:DUF4328 domain-containing protein n=1 Tax=Actinoplanes sp. NPDC051346 TaxID=3155048 RepID=UPI00341C18A1
MTEFAPYTHPPRAFVPYSTARPLRTRSIVAICGLVFAVISTLITAGLTLFALDITRDAITADEDLGQATDLALVALIVAGAVTLIALLFTGIAFICWLHRARKNLDEFGGSLPLKWSPGWAIGGWFVPVANLVIPLLVVNEVDRVTESRLMDAKGWPSGGPRRGRFAAWATLWTTFLIFDRVAGLLDFDPEGQATIVLMLLTAAAEIGAAVSAILLIRRITAFQQEILGNPGLSSFADPPYASAFGAPAWPATPGGASWPAAASGAAWPGGPGAGVAPPGGPGAAPSAGAPGPSVRPSAPSVSVRPGGRAALGGPGAAEGNGGPAPTWDPGADPTIAPASVPWAAPVARPAPDAAPQGQDSDASLQDPKTGPGQVG